MWNREFRHLRSWFEVERVCAVIVCDGGLRGDENLKSFRQAKNFGLASLPLFLSPACLPTVPCTVSTRIQLIRTRGLVAINSLGASAVKGRRGRNAADATMSSV